MLMKKKLTQKEVRKGHSKILLSSGGLGQGEQKKNFVADDPIDWEEEKRGIAFGCGT